MKYHLAPRSLAVKIVTMASLVLTAGILAASLAWIVLLVPGGIALAVVLGCYLRAPIAYEVSSGQLTVLFRLGRKRFGPIVSVAAVNQSIDRSIRLFGNGGLFAATGIFWNGRWGIFRAYCTTSDVACLVLLETQKGKVLLSPLNRGEFMENVSVVTRSRSGKA